jgi:transcriptional regulator with XRE-family HTH domain
VRHTLGETRGLTAFMEIALPPKPNESETEIDEHVGRMLRGFRKGRGVSQESFAAALGVTSQQVQKYELGRNRISASKLFVAASFLEISPGAFFEGLPSLSSALVPPSMAEFFNQEGAREIAESYGRLSTNQRQAVVSVIEGMLE